MHNEKIIAMTWTVEEITAMKIGLAAVMDDIDDAIKAATKDKKKFKDSVLKDMRDMHRAAQSASDKLHIVGNHSIDRSRDKPSDDQIQDDLFTK